MKKIQLLLLFLMVCASMNAQCIMTTASPLNPVVSNNSGDPQQISSCVNTGQYSTLSNMNVGSDYVFSLVLQGAEVVRYITITDINNSVLAHGPSPLTVYEIPEATVRIHYSQDNNCGVQTGCLTSIVKIELTCPFPTNIQVSNVTKTEASFNWVAGGTETSWQILVLPVAATDPTASTVGISVEEDSEYSVNDLTSDTKYKFFVRANCGSEFSPWRGPHEFKTDCDPIETFNENFDTTALGELPSCWSYLLANAASTAYIRATNTLGFSAPNSVQVANGSSPQDAKILLISPKMSTVATASHRLKFFARGYGNVPIQIGTVNTRTSDGVFTLMQQITATSTYAEYTVDFTGYTGTDTYVAFRHPNLTSSNPFFLDDIRWEASPSCPDVTGIVLSSLTPTSATLSWTPSNIASEWDIVYSATESDPELLTPISPSPSEDPEGTITGLQPNTAYRAWVRSSCGDEKGAWMAPVTFTTACNPTNAFNENLESTALNDLPGCWSKILAGSSVINSTIRVVGTYGTANSKAVALYNGDVVENSKIILVSPNLGTLATGTHRIKFYARTNVASTLQVGTLDSGAPGATFTSFQTINTTATYAEYVVDFTGYTGTNTYVGIKHTGNQFVTLYVDDIRWEETPLCPDVTGINVTGITATTADLNWTSNGTETQWDLVYGTADVVDPNTLTPISPAPTVTQGVTISDLQDNTDYKVWIRSACGDPNGNGAWIGPIAFRSACFPMSSFSEGFETTATGSIPDCWKGVVAGPTLGTSSAIRVQTQSIAFGNQAIELYGQNVGPNDYVILVSPYLNTLTTGTHRLKFNAQAYTATNTLHVGTMNGNTSAATFTLQQSYNLANTYTEYIIDFSNYSGTDTYIAFRNVSTTNLSIYLDNLRWEVVPACTDVTAVQITGTTDTTASVTWTPVGNETNWQVVHSPVGVNDPSALTPWPSITETSFTVTGLEGNTSYNFWVRSVCGDGDEYGAWIGPISRKTKCSPATVPFLQDFESAVIPAIPDCSIIQNGGTGNNWATANGSADYGFTSKILRYTNYSSEASAWFFTQGISLTAGNSYVLSYKYGNNSSNTYTEKMQVLYGTDAQISGMVTELADHPQINTGVANTNQVTFTPSETGVYYFGFHAYSAGSQSHLYLDDIALDADLSTSVTTRVNFNYSPNPVKEVLNFSANENISNVTVFNMLGQQVMSKSLNTNQGQIDMSSLAAGAYLVKVNAGNQVETVKILKQ